jgi:glucuronyl/N-acetylglucosaminyl transferase EXT2
MTTSSAKRGRGMLRMQHPYRKFFMFLFAVALFLVIMAFQMLWAHNNNVNKKDQGMPHGHEAFMDITLTTEKPMPTNHSCLFHSCFDVYHCGYNDDNRISVYIYPPLRFLDADGNRVTLPMSAEFHEILTAIRESIYYTSDPDKACLFVPMVDVLNQNHVDIELTAKVRV